MGNTVAFTSDIHGNRGQEEKLLAFVSSHNIQTLLIGGDIAPKDFCLLDDFIGIQRTYFAERFPEIFKRMKQARPNLGVGLMMGNDDCAANMDLLEQHDGELFHLIHNTRVSIMESFDVVGYAYVPPTPVMLKDWEKFDVPEYPPEFEQAGKDKRSEWRLDGLKTRGSRTVSITMDENDAQKDSIAHDLESERFTTNPERTIYVMHAPPYGTNLDWGNRGYGLGSVAVRLFIEKYQPYLTLHGHIHGTVRRSGEFMDKIGKTVSIASGNTNKSSKLAVIVLDVVEPKGAKRIIL